MDEVNRLKTSQDVVDRRLTTQTAAQRLGISDRQCRCRLLSRYCESGPLGMASRRRGKPSNNELPLANETARKLYDPGRFTDPQKTATACTSATSTVLPYRRCHWILNLRCSISHLRFLISCHCCRIYLKLHCAVMTNTDGMIMPTSIPK